jgi:hypothetical protein
MTEHRPEVADVLRTHGPAYLERWGHALSARQKQVLKDITQCRTATLGGHVYACNQCGHRRISYNSCRNRHCPKCQAMAQAEWMADRAADLLPAPYFHMVFTLPEAMGSLALQNKRMMYGILFRAASQTLLQIAADPKHLGAQIGFFLVLHTWGQNLHHHPHVHGVVPGGGIALDRSRWISCKKEKKYFFLPVKVLSRVFRGKFVDLLRKAFQRGELSFHGKLEGLDDPQAFERWLRTTYKTDWVVHAKPPFGGPVQVLKYLARYTHRVAISNRRLIDIEDGKVRFRWKDYANCRAHKTMTLDAVEFIRRFLLHVLPKGFVRIRHYGFLANRHRKQNLLIIRRLLDATRGRQAQAPSDSADSNAVSTDEAGTSLAFEAPSEPRTHCPVCQTGQMAVVEILKPSLPQPVIRPGWAPVLVFDTS